MKESAYDSKWRKMLQETDAPLSAADLTSVTGGSRALVHVWINKNADELIEMGKNPTGGRLFVWKTNPLVDEARPATRRATRGRSEAERTRGDGLHVGAQLEVTSLYVQQGQLVIELTDEDGTSYEATLRLTIKP